MSEGAILYHEPSIITILTQSSFILALNIIYYVLDKAIYCGLIGQILVGTAWGIPGADILGSDFQQAITNLGYLGLILIVFEGGLSTDMRALRSNLVLSLFVALTGITLPIGSSFVLVKMCNATVLQSFAAGCALSSTSLGTTFTVLKSNGLGHSRLGVVLTSAAMLDDVFGLVLVQVISNLGASTGGDFSAVTIVRPVFVSVGYAVLVPILLYLFGVLGPRVHVSPWTSSKVGAVLAPRQVKFTVYTVLLIGAVTSAAYAGTSVLFAAYLVGLLISSSEDYRLNWQKTGKELPVPRPLEKKERKEKKSKEPLDTSAPRDTNDSWEMIATNADSISRATISEASPGEDNVQKDQNSSGTSSTSASTQTAPVDHPEVEASTYEIYYASVVNRFLKGFFFVHTPSPSSYHPHTYSHLICHRIHTGCRLTDFRCRAPSVFPSQPIDSSTHRPSGVA